mmetsp:Transcript_51422/g.111807  ORF Transcript_51422/g.111807 Transcript_51422/m.111807 type:complete len:202 (+) Transcript_51422:249-854(+)
MARVSPLYCLCRKPYDGSFMIQCEQCNEWYHAQCIGLTEKKARRKTNLVCTVCRPPKRAVKAKIEVKKPVYCLCRTSKTAGFMIQCDKCEVWYHGGCVDLAREQGEALHSYICPPCHTATGPNVAAAPVSHATQGPVSVCRSCCRQFYTRAPEVLSSDPASLCPQCVAAPPPPILSMARAQGEQRNGWTWTHPPVFESQGQ